MKIKLTIFAALIVIVSALPALARGQAAGAGHFEITQTYIDTTVLRAIIILNENAAYYSTSGGKQRVAVAQARAVLDNLKRRVKNDINERYALMKIREVEAQIALEEEEMRQIAENKRLFSANKLMFDYNAEVGRTRPDFALLRSIHMRMAEVDARQANIIAASYNRKYREVGRHALYSLEKALAANDIAAAEEELEYCERNKLYLLINPAQLARQRERLESLKNTRVHAADLAAALDRGEKAFNEWRLSESRTNLSMAQNRIHEAQAHIQSADRAALVTRCERLIKALDAREDSLVKVALNILEKKGADAAYAYLADDLQKKYSISHERAVFIDQAILNSSPQRAIETKNRVEMIDAAPVSLTSKDFELFRDMESSARAKARERADSLRAVREKANGISINIYTLLEQNKGRDARALFDRESALLKSSLPPGAFETLEMAIDYVMSTPKPNPREIKRSRQMAQRKAKEEERQTRLELRDVARREAADRKEVARQAAVDKKENDRQAKIDRKSAARQAAVDMKAAQRQAKTDRKDADRQARADTKSAKRQATAAVSTAASSTATVQTASSVQTSTLPAQPTSTAAAPGADPNLLMARDISARIYALVERDNIIEAHRRFQQHRGPLQKYMDAAEFEVLRFMVEQSYNHVRKK